MKIGIEFGTTYSALAYIDEREAEDRDSPPIHIFETPQLVAGSRGNCFPGVIWSFPGLDTGCGSAYVNSVSECVAHSEPKCAIPQEGESRPSTPVPRVAPIPPDDGSGTSRE